MLTRLLALLPLLLSWLACFWLSRELAARKRLPDDWRAAWLAACVMWGTFLVLITEATSLGHAFNAPALFGAWTLLTILLAALAARLSSQRGKLSASALRLILARFKLSGHEQPPMDVKLMAWLAGLLILLLGVVAFALPGTNWDSLTWRLPRVMHWIQQGSVEHFATNNLRQIESAPWAGFAIATLHLLQGSDQSANLIQWFAMLTSVMGATFIAEQLLPASGLTILRDGTPTQQKQFRIRLNAFTALLVVTLPIGALEAVTTQTDCITTCWVACLASFTLVLANDPANLACGLAAGFALALGAFTSGVMWLYALPVLVALAFWSWRKWRAKNFHWRVAAMFLFGFLVINAGHLTRNVRAFGSPFGSAIGTELERNETISFGGTFSNVLRNLLLDSDTGVPPITQVINATFSRLHVLTGHDENDPATTHPEAPFVLTDRFVVTDAHASAPVHLLLVLAAALVLLARVRSQKWLLVYGAGIIASFLLFCALFRWRQSNAQIHLAWLVMLMPLVAIVLTTHAPRRLIFLCSIATIGFVGVVLIYNRSRPLLDLKFAALPRVQQCLKPTAGHLYAPLAQICDDLAASRCRRIGLKLSSEDAEYPLWLMLRQRGYRGRIEHVRVKNESHRFAPPTVMPDAVISIAAPQSPPFTIDFPHQTDYGLFTVFWSEPSSRWEQLTRFDHVQAQSYPMTAMDKELLFSHRLITFYHRAARAGSLKFTGNITDATGLAVRHNSLRVTTNEGEATLPLDGHSIAIELSLPPLESVIKLAVLEPVAVNGGILQLRDFYWSWQPDSAVAVAKIKTPSSDAAK